MDNLSAILKTYWGYDAFRPLQQDIMESILAGRDTLALMPTGGGKSFCYQVPAMTREGLCLVISPLIALMKDQVENLRKKNITAFALYSGMSRKDVINTLKIAEESNCKFLYVSPERLESKLFKEYLPGLDIQLIAVDEAHCISQWGYDFRPPYLRIAALRQELPGIPILALTASATREVQQDICDKLEFKNASVFRQSFERPNLSYSCFHVDAKINKILEVFQKVPGTGIVYCKSRKRTKEVSELLKLHGITADHYHAGLSQEERSSRQENWIQNRIRVIVCTNAFGMGIDKPDVRSVVHADVPDCLENYYQEAGRAGRDGKKSYAVLLYDEKDLQGMKDLASLRFPSIEEIKTVYQSVANYLQVPAGSGEGQYYDFNFQEFTRNFKLEAHTTLYALKTLEQEDWISFNEQVFLPSLAGFTTGKEDLYAFESEKPQFEPVIKTLLRSYEGIFDSVVSISEIQLAGLMRSDADMIRKQLAELHHYHIIEYHPQKDTPQVYFNRNRIRAEEITIDAAGYRKRKEQFQQRVSQMTKFVEEKSDCRSRKISDYFGDTGSKNCGTCDNCLNKKKRSFTKTEFESLQKQILALLEDQPAKSKEIEEKLPLVRKEKIYELVEFLLAEQMIEMDAVGRLRIRN